MLAKAWNDFSTPTRKHSCRSSSCASACLRCASVNRPFVLSCRRSLTRPTIGQPSCDWRRLTAFLTRLRNAAETLDVTECQRILRLVVKGVLVGDETITTRHNIPVQSRHPHNDTSTHTLPPSHTDT